MVSCGDRSVLLTMKEGRVVEGVGKNNPFVEHYNTITKFR